MNLQRYIESHYYAILRKVVIFVICLLLISGFTIVYRDLFIIILILEVVGLVSLIKFLPEFLFWKGIHSRFNDNSLEDYTISEYKKNREQLTNKRNNKGLSSPSINTAMNIAVSSTAKKNSVGKKMKHYLKIIKFYEEKEQSETL